MSERKNGFEMHGIEHLSNSSISLWESNPAQWVMNYLLKQRRPAGAAMIRVTVDEDAVVDVLNGNDVEQAIQDAEKAFDEKVGSQDV